MGYIRKHWRGELPLGISFWVNITLLNIVFNVLAVLCGFGIAGKDTIISKLSSLLSTVKTFAPFGINAILRKPLSEMPEIGDKLEPLIDNPVTMSQAAILFIVFSLFVLLPWQYVGVWRSGTNHIKRHGKRFWAITAKVVLVLGLLSHVNIGVYQWPLYSELFKTGFLKDELGEYRLNLYSENTVLYLKGELAFGISEDVSRILEKNTGVTKLILDSRGGRVYEGRQLAEVVIHYKLDTYVSGQCYSAAGLPFAAGKQRFLCKGAKLGFHQYLYPENLRGYFNIDKEQQRDKTFYMSRGVKRGFVNRIFNTPTDDFWFPTKDELVDSGMIQDVIPIADVMPMEDAIVLGFDTCRTSQTVSISNTVTAEQVKGWILGCSGVLWECNRDGFKSLGSWKDSRRKKKEMLTLLSDGWDIKDRDDLLRDLFWLAQEDGHRDNFARDGRFVSKMSKEQLEVFLEPFKDNPERCNDLRVAYQFYDSLGDKGILGWDLCRYMCLCRGGYICGFLDEETTWKLMIPAARKLQQTFGSWEELGQNYLIGRHYWSLKHVQQEKKKYDEAFQRLIEMPSSPWNQYAWELDLTCAEELIEDSLKTKAAAETPSSNLNTEAADSNLAVPVMEISKLTEPNFAKVNILEELQQAGPVITVPNDYPTIQAAIDAAQKGDTIFIKEGVYDGWIQLHKKEHIRIIGQSADKVRLSLSLPEKNEVVLVEACQNILISDLTVEDQQTEPNGVKSGIGVCDSTAEIERCKVINRRGNGISYYKGAQGTLAETDVRFCINAGIAVMQENTRLNILNSHISENKSDGVCVYEGARVDIAHSFFTQNSVGLSISGQKTNVVMSDCIVANNNRGIVVFDTARIQVTNILCKSNNLGIHVVDKESCLDGSRLYSLENSFEGIFVEKNGTALLNECVFAKNKKNGVLVLGPQANVRLTKTQCSENGTMGIMVSNQAIAVIEDCICFKNREEGINIYYNSTATIRKCSIKDNGGSGIRIVGGASGQMEDNTCENNMKNGIDVFKDAASAVLRANRCTGNQISGISFSGGANGTVEDNICQDNNTAGIVVYEKDTHAILNKNQCSRNGGNGITFNKGASGAVENCISENNYEAGIGIYGVGANIELRRNEIRSNQYNGVVIGKDTGPGISLIDNRCFSNYPSGMLLMSNITGKVSDNICQNNPWAGIVVDGNSVCSALDKNQFSQNGTWGILILNDANPTLENNTLEQNGKGAISNKRLGFDVIESN